MHEIQSTWPSINSVDAAYEFSGRDISFLFKGKVIFPKDSLGGVKQGFRNSVVWSSTYRAAVLGSKRQHYFAWISQTHNQIWVSNIREKDWCSCICKINWAHFVFCWNQILEVRKKWMISLHEPLSSLNIVLIFQNNIKTNIILTMV